MIRKSMYPERYGGTEGMSEENAEMIWNHLGWYQSSIFQIFNVYTVAQFSNILQSLRALR
jgi:hypothetical protein